MWKIIIVMSFFVYCVHCECQTSRVRPRVFPVSSPVINRGISVKWDDCTQSAVYVDYLATGQQPSIFRYDNNEDRTYSAYIEGKPAPRYIVPVNKCMKTNNNQYLVSIGLTGAIINWDGISPVATFERTLFTIPTDDPTLTLAIGRREGSGKGRFYTGTIHTALCNGASNASFYQYSRENGVREIFTGTKSTTGTATDTNAGKVYHIDGCLGLITGYDLDEDGNVCNGRIIYDFSSTGDYLSGLDIDEDGQLYTASVVNGAIITINPKSGIARTITRLPIPRAGGLSFGGKDRKTLFVVAGSSINDRSGKTIEYIEGPSLYKVTCVGAQGRRFYVGTFHSLYCGGANNASFYEYSQEKGLQLVFTGTKTTTGVAFNNDATKIYHLDTCLERITGFDLDNGKICNGQIIRDFKNKERVPLLDAPIGGLPVGLDSDENGMLYTVSSVDGTVVRINPRTGDVHMIAKLPVPGSGGVTFGGSDRKTLFAVAGSTLVDPFNGNVLARNTGHSLYKIKCVGAQGHKYTRLYL